MMNLGGNMNSSRILACIIVGLLGSSIHPLDFLNDPFFKQLAQELDTMFGADDAVKGAPPSSAGQRSTVPAFSSPTTTPKPAAKTSGDVAPTQQTSDAGKDLKTLFIENAIISNPPTKGPHSTTPSLPPRFGQRAATPPPVKGPKAIISKERLHAYHFYMDSLIKKTRLLERLVQSNPGRVFNPLFLHDFESTIRAIDKLEVLHHLMTSKKIYLRTFFGPAMQPTRKNIVALEPRIELLLKKLRPLIKKEESLDEDITKMRREADKIDAAVSTQQPHQAAPTPKKKTLPQPAKSGSSPSLKTKKPSVKSFMKALEAR